MDVLPDMGWINLDSYQAAWYERCERSGPMTITLSISRRCLIKAAATSSFLPQTVTLKLCWDKTIPQHELDDSIHTWLQAFNQYGQSNHTLNMTSDGWYLRPQYESMAVVEIRFLYRTGYTKGYKGCLKELTEDNSIPELHYQAASITPLLVTTENGCIIQKTRQTDRHNITVQHMGCKQKFGTQSKPSWT